MGAGKNRPANRKTLTILDGLIKGKMRVKQPLKIYSKMYYTLQVKHNNPLDSTDTTIVSIHGQIENWFKAEPQEIQDEVMHVHMEQTTSKNDKSVAEDEEDAYLDIDLDTLQRWLVLLSGSSTEPYLPFQ